MIDANATLIMVDLFLKLLTLVLIGASFYLLVMFMLYTSNENDKDLSQEVKDVKLKFADTVPASDKRFLISAIITFDPGEPNRKGKYAEAEDEVINFEYDTGLEDYGIYLLHDKDFPQIRNEDVEIVKEKLKENIVGITREELLRMQRGW